MSSELHLGLVKLGTMFPLEEDLISANAGDDRRVQQLRQLLLSQLDLIQKQSEAIVTKDNHIKELKSHGAGCRSSRRPWGAAPPRSCQSEVPPRAMGSLCSRQPAT